MNPSTAIFLIDEGVRAVAVTYDAIDLNKDTTKMKFTPAYLASGKLPTGAVLFKTMDKEIQVDDFVIVPTNTRHGMTVCQVKAVDVDVDFDSDDEVHWLVGKVDTAPFEAVRQQEEKILVAVKDAETGAKRKELSDNLKASLGDKFSNIPQLAAPANMPAPAPAPTSGMDGPAD